MLKTSVYICLILITFSSCSDEAYSDQIEGTYSWAKLITPDFEQEIMDAQISYLANGAIEIDLGSPLGVLKGDISDDSEIIMQPFLGFTSSGVELNFPTGDGDFTLEEIDMTQIKNVHISFVTLGDRRHLGTLWLQSQ